MTPPDSIDAIRGLCAQLPDPSADAREAAASRQAVLTKPLGSLGRLEELALLLASWQNREIPTLENVEVLIFAGAHGITGRGVSAFPDAVNAQMVANFEAGGAAINQLSRIAGASLKIFPLALDTPTNDFTQSEAMSEEEFVDAVASGFNAIGTDADLITIGEMGIGNTTTAATIAAALFGGDGASWVGRGTGVDDEGLRRKAETVDAALALHTPAIIDAVEALRRVGGRELAGMFGAVLAARLRRIPVIIDGFVATAAAAVLARQTEGGLRHAIAGHVSAEAQHQRLLDHLGLSPLLDMDMRLGEGTGACLAINILRSAVACHSGMATFEEAGVAGK
ncbi:nicotinate-nucleotide--dimethylbenzimidazole phosphoribosyltransferase [Aquamicrobium zhengzhouense]|uniref:Nicotinate-nucleotide--dimethylbenzimidazole phosphoribosyltransferase n=1 Tax=Aquamicrobium zhengzhouense TaxID=2781738 RepID=A0ABS0S8V0_9HYPH|nr:nicotinate-nucleotide--dimethylbenzimidazole phosphoribosyltransferase [Aquamicrobium zhengzhouense]MBI1619224.1 nicotinate-nucleotide--dimethylbenzimidazole phosphoribosyltransferase [Aquamicrobium zhengzhouense]